MGSDTHVVWATGGRRHGSPTIEAVEGCPAGLRLLYHHSAMDPNLDRNPRASIDGFTSTLTCLSACLLR